LFLLQTIGFPKAASFDHALAWYELDFQKEKNSFSKAHSEISP